MTARRHPQLARRVAQRGIALVLALWLTILLTVIASGFAFSMRSEALATRNALSLAQARAAADGAVERAAYELQRPRLPDAWTLDGTPHTWQEGDLSITVVAVDEAARIDLNVAPDALLKSMLLAQGLEDDKAASIAAAIADWRDPDDFKRPSGAEEADYRAAGLKYGPANGPFETVAEVGRVLGVTGDLYARLAAICTVYSRQPGINPLTAGREVLLSLPNATAEAVDAYLAQRAAALTAKLPVPPFPPAQAYVSGAIPVWRIRADASFRDGVTFAREAVLRPSADAARPLIALAWLEPPPGALITPVDAQAGAAAMAATTRAGSLGNAAPATNAAATPSSSAGFMSRTTTPGPYGR
jgi:general secretion pathway protein K